MYMGNYWAALTNKMTPAEALKRYPKEVNDLIQHHGVESIKDLRGEFAFDLYPSFDPAGPFSDADDVAYPEDDAGDEPLPTVTDKKSLFFYDTDADELYDLQNDCMLWNY